MIKPTVAVTTPTTGRPAPPPSWMASAMPPIMVYPISDFAFPRGGRFCNPVLDAIGTKFMPSWANDGNVVRRRKTFHANVALNFFFARQDLNFFCFCQATDCSVPEQDE